MYNCFLVIWVRSASYSLNYHSSSNSIFKSAYNFISSTESTTMCKLQTEKLKADEKVHRLGASLASVMAQLAEKETELTKTQSTIAELKKKTETLDEQFEREKKNSEAKVGALQLQLLEKLFDTKTGAANDLKLTEEHLRVIEQTNRDALSRRDELISTLEERIVELEHELEDQTRKSHEKQLQLQLEMMEKLSTANTHSSEIVKQAENSLRFLEQANYATLKKKDEIISQYEKERRSIRKLAKLTAATTKRRVSKRIFK
uniref:Uncharacterized protein n=1 Tax=Corethron hystrix TaxID=216773 RepID=A0A6U5DRJ4_9STRA|mmetsp:Transcript_13436/g.29687  ORF Transcript_13436/g.29687 Transcript_13436/m.29687 type:complete len:260 (+) Transcript_13436:665-1444(+)